MIIVLSKLYIKNSKEQNEIKEKPVSKIKKKRMEKRLKTTMIMTMI